MEMNQPTTGFSARLRWSGWINLLAASLAVVTLGVALNYYAHRHYQGILGRRISSINFRRAPSCCWAT